MEIQRQYTYFSTPARRRRKGGTEIGILSPDFTFDAARYLDSDEAVREYLAAACEEGNPDEIARALGVIARARGMSDLSQKTGLTRQALYKALSGDGNPAFATVTKVAGALGLRLSVEPMEDNRSVP